MKRWAAVLLAVALIALPGAFSAAAETHAGFEAVCRISNTNSKGTGTVFSETGDSYRILTNYHVVANAQTVGVEFWRNGHLSRSIPGKVIWTSFLNNANRDMAVVEVPKAAFGSLKPHIIPLAARGTVIPIRGTITSVGCASGAWATAWEGHVLTHRGPVYDFVPAPAGGRSGSALYSKDGKTIVGLIAWRAAGDTHGIAMTLEEIYRAFEGKGPVPATIGHGGREIPIGWDTSTDGLVPVCHDQPMLVYEVPVCGGGGMGGVGGMGMMPFVETQPTYVWDGTQWVQCGPGGCQPFGGGGRLQGNGPFSGGGLFGGNQQGPYRGNPYQGGGETGPAGGGAFPTYPGGSGDSGGPAAEVPSAVTQTEFDGLSDRVTKIEQTMLTKSEFDKAMTSLKGSLPDTRGLDMRLAGVEANLAAQRKVDQELSTQLISVDERVTQTATTTATAVSQLEEKQRTVFGDVKLAISTFAEEYKGAREGGAEAGKEAGTEAAKALLLAALQYTGLFAGLPLGGAGLIWLGSRMFSRVKRRRENFQ